LRLRLEQSIVTLLLPFPVATPSPAAEGELEGQMNFLAFFSRRDNPHLLQYLEEFNETIELLFN